MYKVLYVEDEFQSFKLVELILKKYNIDVYLAKDGLEALELAETIVPDLIIMDINLPKLKGFEAAAILKSKKSTNHIPIIALTAVNDESYEKLSMAAGCEAFLTKPIDPKSFANLIIKFIEKRDFTEKEIDLFSKELSISLKNKAESLAKLEKELLNLNYKLNKILGSLPEAVFIVNKDFEINYMNTKALQIKISNESFLTTKQFFDIFSLIEYDTDYLKEELLEKDKIEGIYSTLNDSSNRYFLSTFTTFDDDILVSLKEITDLKAFEDNIKHLEKLATIGQITSGIIHEINNPLTSIKNYITVLNQICKDEMQKDILNKLTYGIDRLESLAQNLVTFVRKPTEKKYPINLNNAIKSILSFSDYEIRRGNVQIKLELEDDLPLIFGHTTSIEQMILNLLINANHAVNEVESPTIIIKTYSTDKFVFLEIIDNGKGIPKEIQDKIFEPFFTTKPEGKGTGLGLAIVKKIVEEHNGEITFTTSDIGTSFVIKLKKDDGSKK
ncbi:ATP-binding protein [Deferribacter thermophilus]|uniref:ATP-binding protein n=1 Tax=Deferribacter thermophilus TaxID=53573 RepID=UPI003C24D47C